MRDLVATLMELQEGVASRAQLRRLGWSDSAIDRAGRNGDLTRWLPTVYRLSGAPTSPMAHLVAARLWNPEVVFSYSTAAALQSFEGHVLSHAEFTVPRRHRSSLRASWPGFVLHSSIDLGPGSIETFRRALPPKSSWQRALRPLVCASFTITTASRTVIDLAQYSALGGDEVIGAAIDSACSLGKSSPAFLRQMVDRLQPGRPWTARVHRELVDAGGHSWLERNFLRLMRSAGLPRPTVQVVHRRDGSLLRVDFEFHPDLLIVEVSGRRGHSSDADRAKDARRRNELQSIGYRVLEFTRADVVDDAAYVVREVRRALVRNAA